MKQLLFYISFILAILLANPIYSQELTGKQKAQIQDALQGRWEWNGRIKISDNNYVSSHAKLIIDGNYITEYTDGEETRSVIRNIDINSKKIYYGNDTYLEFDIDDNGNLRLYGDKKRNIQFKKTSNSPEFSDELTRQIKQCERRGLPLSDISGLNLGTTLNGQSHFLAYTDDKYVRTLSVSVIKKNNQEGYWTCTWAYNFASTMDGKIMSTNTKSYPYETFTIPGKIRLGDYEWKGEIAPCCDFSRPKSYYCDKIVWVNRVAISPPDNVKKIIFKDGYIAEALIRLSASSKIEEIHLPRSLKDIELFVNGLQDDVFIFLPVEEPWEIIDGERVSLFGRPPTKDDWMTVNGKRTLISDYNSKNAPFNEKIVFVVPDGSVEKYRKLERFKNTRVCTNEEYLKMKEENEREKERKIEREKEWEKERVLQTESSCRQIATAKKHLFTSDELNRIERGPFSTWNIFENIRERQELYDFSVNVEERQELYDIINQNPDMFSTDYYYRIITEHRNLSTIKKAIKDSVENHRLAENYNKLIGKWKANKGGSRNTCNIVFQNNQFYLTLKYDGDIIFEGIVKNNEKNKVTAKEIVFNINFSRVKQSYGNMFLGPILGPKRRTIRYHFYYEDGQLILKEYISGKTNTIFFRKK